MQLREIMTRTVEVIAPETSLTEAAQKMKAFDVGLMPVCDGDVLKGMLTDRDITVRAIADGRDPRSTSAEEVMTAEVTYCFDDEDIWEAARLMEECQIRRLPILDRNMRLVGIVSLGDLAVRTRDEPLVGEVLEQISEPVHLTS